MRPKIETRRILGLQSVRPSLEGSGPTDCFVCLCEVFNPRNQKTDIVAKTISLSREKVNCFSASPGNKDTSHLFVKQCLGHPLSEARAWRRLPRRKDPRKRQSEFGPVAEFGLVQAIGTFEIKLGSSGKRTERIVPEVCGLLPEPTEVSALFPGSIAFPAC